MQSTLDRRVIYLMLRGARRQATDRRGKPAAGTLPAMKGPGIALDPSYVVSLGPQAIPAIDRYLDNRTPDSNWWLKGKRDGLAVMHLDGTHGWRAWTWRNRQLTRHLRRTR